MRSIGLTLVLAFAAAIACGVAAWQIRVGSFDAVFGVPPVPVGDRLYTDFRPEEVKRIRVKSDGVTAVFSLEDGGWRASAPWEDRMDPRAALSIIQFALSMRVEDYAETDDVDKTQAGLNKKAVTIRLQDAGRRTLAEFRLGRPTPWKAEFEKIEEPVPTVFVLPREKNRREYVYSCTGDISPLFNDGLRYLRDHRPFYFNPMTLQTIRIRSQQGDLSLGRQEPTSPWRIVKPLDLPTDPEAIKNLLEGLYELQAVRVRDREDVTLPESGEAMKTQQIAIQAFDSESETLLEIHPAESPEALELLATVSDRPGTVFDLPLKPEAGLVSLASLPLSVNDLRDPRLTHLQVASLRGISIEPSTGTPITISRQPPQPWMVAIGESSREANEENLFSLLKAVTSARAIGFESDAATDMSPWGLDRPFLKLRFLGEDNQGIELRFGMDSSGGYFVNRLGTPTVMRVDESLVSAIAVRPYEWKHARPWSINRINLLSIKRSHGDAPPLILKYNYDEESWKAERDGRNVSDSLDPARANYLLSVLEDLKVVRWLSSTDTEALAALEKPSIILTVTEFAVNDEFETTGVVDHEITLAPGGAGENPGFYYGRVNTDSNPFLISAETYGKLTADLFDAGK